MLQKQSNTKNKNQEKKNKQIKILSITACPKENSSVKYDEEQGTILNAFRSFDPEELFLAIPDLLKGTLTEIEERLLKGHHDILLLTVSTKSDKEKGILFELEDDSGELSNVSVQEFGHFFLQLKEESGIKIPILILSSSHLEQKEFHYVEAAEGLKECGFESVISVRENITSPAAQDFYSGLASALIRREMIVEAFESAIKAVSEGENKRIREDPDLKPLKEEQIPQLISNNDSLYIEDFSSVRLEVPETPIYKQFMGYEFPREAFVGRRDVLREIYSSIEKKEPAILLKGPGGVGKSTVLSLVKNHFENEGFVTVEVRGKTNPEMILKELTHRLTQSQSDSENHQQKENKFEETIEIKQKILWLMDHFLTKEKIVLILEDFESNQSSDGKIENVRMRELVSYIKDSFKEKDAFLILSTLYDMKGFKTIEVKGFTEGEFRKFITHKSVLKTLDDNSLKTLYFDMGGSPRCIELLDKLGLQEFGGEAFNWQRLRDLVPRLHERVLYREREDTDFSHLLVEKLLDFLDEQQRNLMNGLSLFRVPVSQKHLEGIGIEFTNKDREKLKELSLIDYEEEKELYYVHPLTTSTVLGLIKDNERKLMHFKAAEFYRSQKVDKEKAFENFLEARWHYRMAEIWNSVAEVTFELDEFLMKRAYPQLVFELFEEIENKKIKDQFLREIHNRLGIFHALFGDFDKAIPQNEKSFKISEKLGDTKGTAYSMGQLGMLLHRKGKFSDALINYEKALDIYEKSNDQREISQVVHQIGRIKEESGELDIALSHYERSMEIDKGVNDSRGIAANNHQLANISLLKGKYDEAFELYNKSIDLRKKIGDVYHIGNSLGQLGLIYQRKGNLDAALEQYEESLKVFEKIGDVRGISASLHQVGRIYQVQGKKEEALEKFKKSLELREKSGDVSGMAVTHGQLGMLNLDMGEYEDSMRNSIKAFLIFNKMNSPHAQLAQKNINEVRKKIPREKFNEILKEFDITPEEEIKKEENQKEQKDQKEKIPQKKTETKKKSAAKEESSGKAKKDKIAKSKKKSSK